VHFWGFLVGIFGGVTKLAPLADYLVIIISSPKHPRGVRVFLGFWWDFLGGAWARLAPLADCLFFFQHLSLSLTTWLCCGVAGATFWHSLGSSHDLLRGLM
jgi:hypothetical protein